MRAISLHQPHATFVALGLKPFETRGWATSYRGPLLIHAAKQRMSWDDLRLLQDVRDAAPDNFYEQLTALRIPHRAFLCIVNLVDCKATEDHAVLPPPGRNGLGDFSARRFAWHLMNVRRFLQPVAAKGFQRFWNVDFNDTVATTEVQPMEQIIF